MHDVHSLCAASQNMSPDCCQMCVFWQERDVIVDADRRTRWATALERQFGAWGQVLSEGGRFRGQIQYGPAGAFPRANVMPAGPVSRDAVLITCAYLSGDDLAATCEHLLLQALADLKSRGVTAVEAFAVAHATNASEAVRFQEHHTLFDEKLLTRLGFTPVRRHAPVALMRLSVTGIQESTAAARIARTAARWLPGALPIPATRTS